MDNKFEQLSLIEIAQLIKSSARDASLPANELMMLYQRLMDIAFMDHGIPHSDRSDAESLAEIIDVAIQSSSNLSPQAKDQFENAKTAHKDSITCFGKGAIIWDMAESELPPPELMQDEGIAVAKRPWWRFWNGPL